MLYRLTLVYIEYNDKNQGFEDWEPTTRPNTINILLYKFIYTNQYIYTRYSP
jgi:hypothetical protein